MSYVFKIEKKDGQLTVTCDAPQYVPDGIWTVNGHMVEPGGGMNSLYVSQAQPNGALIMNASAGAQVPAVQPAPAAQEAGA